MSIINYYNLYFNTKNRSSGTPDYCTFNLLTPLILTSNVDSFFRVSLSNLEIPFAWTSLRSATLTYKFNTTTNTINIVDGNYNITQLLTQISTQVLASMVASGITGRTFNFTFDSTFQKATLDFGTASNNDTMIFYLNFCL